MSLFEMPNFSRKRVAPKESTSDIIEIRPSRFLRIQHHNPRPRDERFSREMGIFMEYKKSGIPSSGPLMMSKRLSTNASLRPSKLASDNNAEENEIKSQINTSQITNVIVSENLTFPSIHDDDVLSSFVNQSLSSSVYSTPFHANQSDKIQSASSVLVALHSSKQGNRKDHQNLIQDSTTSGSPLFERTSDKQSIPYSDSHNVEDDITGKDSYKTNDCMGKIETSSNYHAVFGNCNDNSDIVLFFIHGVGGSSEIWCAQIRYFVQRGYEVIAPDLIGHGFSCCPKNAKAYHFKEIAADLEELFDRYCKKRNIVVGHSYGGSFATLLGRTRSKRIHKLVLISSGPPTPLAPQRGVFTLPTCLLGCIKPCLLVGFKKGAFYKKRKPEISKNHAFCIPTTVLQHMMNGQDWPDGDQIYHNWLTCPCLLIYGEKDPLVSLQDELYTLKEIFNSHLEVVKNASHMVMMEAPIEVNELLERFIEEALNSHTHFQDSRCNSVADSVNPSFSFKRQKSVISLKSHIRQKSKI